MVKTKIDIGEFSFGPIMVVLVSIIFFLLSIVAVCAEERQIKFSTGETNERISHTNIFYTKLY